MNEGWMCWGRQWWLSGWRLGSRTVPAAACGGLGLRAEKPSMRDVVGACGVGPAVHLQGETEGGELEHTLGLYLIFL